MTESQILKQDKKGQGETNARLETLVAAQQETNRLLAALLHAMTGQAPQPPARY